MHELVMIVREGCPYCETAEESIALVMAEHPELNDIRIKRIQADTREAERYDCFYSPAYFVCGEKLSEGECGTEAALYALRSARGGILNAEEGHT